MNKVIKQYQDGKRNFCGANLIKADLTEADLRRADLSRAYLRCADLTGAKLNGADLRWADLREAELRGANLSGAKLSGADMSEADLHGANLTGAYLHGANLIGADLSRVNMCGARYNVLVVLQATFGDVTSPQLIAKMMAFDRESHPHPEAFAVWANGGNCPLNTSSIQRALLFDVQRKHYSHSLAAPSPWELWTMIAKELEIKI